MSSFQLFASDIFYLDVYSPYDRDLINDYLRVLVVNFPGNECLLDLILSFHQSSPYRIQQDSGFYLVLNQFILDIKHVQFGR